METLLNSFFLVFVSEMGDKTQLLALILALKFKKPFIVLSAIFFATILNHGLATYLGVVVASLLDPEVLKWLLALLFIGFGLWILIPDEESEIKKESRFGPFLTTFILFFLAEMGDKTQLATIALGAKFANLTLVTIGTTVGMMASNALAICFGDAFLKKVPMKTIRILACASFMAFAVAILVTDTISQ